MTSIHKKNFYQLIPMFNAILGNMVFFNDMNDIQSDTTDIYYEISWIH